MLFNAIGCNVVSGLTNSSDRLTPISVGLSSIINNQQIIIGIKSKPIYITSNIPEIFLQTADGIVVSNIGITAALPQVNLVYYGNIDVNSITILTNTKQIQITTSVLLHLVKNLVIDIIISDIVMSYGLHAKSIHVNTQILKPFLRAWGFTEPASQWNIEKISNDWVIKY